MAEKNNFPEVYLVNLHISTKEKMINKIFIKISKRVSFCFAVALFSTTWSWIAAFYGFYFVYATAEFSSFELHVVTVSALSGTGGAILLHFVSYGLLHPFGLSGFSKSVRTVNTYLDSNYVFVNYKNIENSEIEKIYRAVSYLPGNNFITACFFTIMVIVGYGCAYCIYGEVNAHSGKFSNLSFLIMGGVFAVIIIGYFTYIITDYLTGPYKRRLEEILFEKMGLIQSRYILSFRQKSVYTLVLISFSMVLLTIFIWESEKPIFQIVLFICLSLFAIGLLIFLSMNTVNIALTKINKSTKRLAQGESGMYFPTFSDRELIIFSHHYNRAAVEINEIRADLEKKISERTEELSTAYNKLNDAYRQIQADLMLAKRIQNSILPKNFKSITGVKPVIHYYPMGEVGGDIYDIIELTPGYFRIILADAAGHGVQAALVTMIIKGEYEKIKYHRDPSVLLEILNNSFLHLYESLNVFFSCIIVDIDLRRNKVIYTSAGHPDQYLIHGDEIITLSHTGKLVGILKGTNYESVTLDLNPDDKLVLFTDGLFEEFDRNEEEFGENRILKIIEGGKSSNPDIIIESILSSLRDFLGRDEVSRNDDITIIGIEINRENSDID